MSNVQNLRLGVTSSMSAIALMLWCPASAFAQDAASPGSEPEASYAGADDIVVTARKRVERLDDVPISVSVISGSQLDQRGVANLDQVAQSMPGVTVTPTPVGDLLYIRGMGSGQNQGFEMSVATFVDGVHFGRGRSARHAFLDVDRVEVLKGPQSILFGKNTTAGAFNISTRRPTDSFEASIDEYIEPQFSTFQTTGVISGPISSTLKARLVARSIVSDGYLKNDFLNKPEQRRNDWVVRGVVEWNPTESFEIVAKGEYGRNNVKGGPSQVSTASPLLKGLVLAIDPKADFKLDYRKSGPGTFAPFNQEYDRGDIYNATVNASLDIGDFNISSVSAYVGYDLDYSFDSDFTPLDLVQQVWDQKWSMWSQELRFRSPEGPFEYTGGVYYSSENLTNDKLFAFNFLQTPLSRFGSADRIQNFKQATRNWSVFAEGTWHPTDQLSLIGGVRFTNDDKTVDKRLFWGRSGSAVADPTITRFTPLGLGVAHNYAGLRKKTRNTSLGMTVQYDPGAVMYYASYRQGFKAGGFDEGNASGKLSEIAFDDEKVDSFEIGVKGRVAGGKLQVRAAAFLNKYDNLQVSMFDGVAALIVGNAARSSTRGAELELQLAASRKLSIGATVSYLDAHYTSYKAGPCAFGRGAVCDLSGQTLPFAPKWSGTLNAHWEDGLAGGWTYALDANAFYSGAFDTAGDMDPFVIQRAFAKVDASISIRTPDDRWRFTLMGKNLTDKVTAHFGNDIPLSNVLGNNYQQFVDPPRTVAIQVRYQFR